MVTKEAPHVAFFRLQFEDSNDQRIYQNVLSKHIGTAIYYAKKMMEQNPWLLVDFYQIIIFSDMLWTKKYIVRYTTRSFNSVMRIYCVLDALRHFNQIL